jgi:MtaA/CmuA family methyltransferase
MTSTPVSGRQRTLDFIAGDPVDRAPFHPIVMRFAARHAGVRYRDFCLDSAVKCNAMIRCAEDFGADWVTVMSDPYAEAEAFGVMVEYPDDDLPIDKGHFTDIGQLLALRPYDVAANRRTANRLKEISNFRRLIGDRYFVVGWVEGPIAEYSDLRGVTESVYDIMDEPEAVGRVMDMITEAAMAFAELQIKAGADCIGIGDAFGSQIGRERFRQFAFPREKALVDHVHALGAKVKLHICGNTSAILPDMIATGADILDVDHLVPSFEPFVGLLAPTQVFSGKTDPVSIIEKADPQTVCEAARRDFRQAGGRCIISGGCEITPGTTQGNLAALAHASIH